MKKKTINKQITFGFSYEEDGKEIQNETDFVLEYSNEDEMIYDAISLFLYFIRESKLENVQLQYVETF